MKNLQRPQPAAACHCETYLTVDPKFRVEGVAPHQPFFFSEN